MSFMHTICASCLATYLLHPGSGTGFQMFFSGTLLLVMNLASVSLLPQNMVGLKSYSLESSNHFGNYSFAPPPYNANREPWWIRHALGRVTFVFKTIYSLCIVYSFMSLCIQKLFSFFCVLIHTFLLVTSVSFSFLI